jgi:hypothetical protein
MRYISPKEAAAKWGVSQRRVNTLCAEGRIEGAVRHSRVWLIPEAAEKPTDARTKSGRYIKGDPEALTAEAEKMKPGETGLLGLDWENGNRTILVDQRLTGLLVGMQGSPLRAAASPTFTPTRAMAKPPSWRSTPPDAATWSGSPWTSETGT